MAKYAYALISAAAIAAFLPAAAIAAAAGAAGGCIAGAVVGGPVGCAVGAVIGGTIVAPPAPVVTYVTAQPVPAATATYALTGNLVVGATIPKTVVLTPVPATVYAVPAGGVSYGYAYINGRRVIVDTNTYAVVAIP
jgi:hypothetical protein